MMNAFTDDLKSVVHKAHEVCDEWLLSDHLLLALAEIPSGAQRVLQSRNITPDALRVHLSPGPGGEWGEVPFSPAVKFGLQAAAESARARGTTKADTIDLLLALTRDDAPSGAVDVLHHLDVDVSALRSSAQEALH